MPRPRSRCWTWNHRWICAQAMPCQQIWLNHSDRSQATEQMLALQEPLRLESNDITVTGDGTHSLSHQTSARLLWAIVSNGPSPWPLSWLWPAWPSLIETPPIWGSWQPCYPCYVYSWSHSLSPLRFCWASPWLALKENPVKMIRQVSSMLDVSPQWFPSRWLPPSLCTLVTNPHSFTRLDLGLGLCSWLSFMANFNCRFD